MRKNTNIVWSVWVALSGTEFIGLVNKDCCVLTSITIIAEDFCFCSAPPYKWIYKHTSFNAAVNTKKSQLPHDKISWLFPSILFSIILVLNSSSSSPPFFVCFCTRVAWLSGQPGKLRSSLGPRVCYVCLFSAQQPVWVYQYTETTQHWTVVVPSLLSCTLASLKCLYDLGELDNFSCGTMRIPPTLFSIPLYCNNLPRHNKANLLIFVGRQSSSTVCSRRWPKTQKERERQTEHQTDNPHERHTVRREDWALISFSCLDAQKVRGAMMRSGIAGSWW